jgi:hypothetical protein
MTDCEAYVRCFLGGAILPPDMGGPPDLVIPNRPRKEK